MLLHKKNYSRTFNRRPIPHAQPSHNFEPAKQNPDLLWLGGFHAHAMESQTIKT
jgi:hypothetical protein